jgi:hypothetical protein
VICPVNLWRVLLFTAVVTSIALPIRLNSARSAELSKPETVTIQTNREREVRRQIDTVVSSAVITYMNDSLERWDTPICPLVAGLPKERGEFILGRVSEIARDAHAPLGPENCRPNLYVVVTDNPDDLLQKWFDRDANLFSTCNGMGYVKQFLRSRQPVRVYYNARFSSDSGSPIELQSLHLELSGDGCRFSGGVDTRLRYGSVQELTSVIIVVDSRRTANVNMGQLADYIAMVGLAQIRLDKETGTAPTILRLFRQVDPQLPGLSPWDQAFLRSLYFTDQASTLQVNMIKRHMFEQIVGR